VGVSVDSSPLVHEASTRRRSDIACRARETVVASDELNVAMLVDSFVEVSDCCTSDRWIVVDCNGELVLDVVPPPGVTAAGDDPPPPPPPPHAASINDNTKAHDERRTAHTPKQTTSG